MKPSRRKVTDEEIFAAVQRAIQQRGPHELTLAHIAAEAGITPGLLVQRFGGKRELMLAVSNSFAGSVPAVFQSLRAANPGPLATVRAYAACMACLAASPDALSRNLAWLQVDLTDEAFRENLLANARATRRQLASLLRAAIAAGELRQDTNATRLARTVEAIISGSLMTWACYRKGPAGAWIREDLDAVLKPHEGVRSQNETPKPEAHILTSDS